MSTPSKINVNYLLGKLQEERYAAPYSMQDQVYDPRYGHHFPYFSQHTVKTMVRDSRIIYGLGLLKGPIATYTKFFDSEEAESPDIHTAIVELNYHFPYSVKADNKETEQFIIDQLNRFWEVGLYKALTSIEYGYSASEVQYRKNEDGKIEFHNLHLYPHFGTQCVTKQKGIIGFVRNNDRTTYVPLGKGFWTLNRREYNPYYGESTLKGSHIPWHETWMLGGARDIRRTWFFKNAYDGGELYYPEGSFQDEAGNVVTHEEYAIRMLELKRTGSAMAFPSVKDAGGKKQWEYEPPKSGVTPGGLEQYIDLLRDEMLEGMGIPPEIVQSAGNDGMGSATGRMVPLMAFIASLTPIGSHVLGDFCTQVLNTLLVANKMSTNYKIRRIVPKTPQQPGEGKAKPQQEQTVQDTGLAV